MDVTLHPSDYRFIDDLMPSVQDAMRLPWLELSLPARQWVVACAGTHMRSGWGIVPLSKERAVVSMAKLATQFQPSDHRVLEQYVWIDLNSVYEPFQRVNVGQTWLLTDHFHIAYTLVRAMTYRRALVKRDGILSLTASITHQNAMLKKYGPKKRCRVCNAKMVQRCFVCSHRALEDEGDAIAARKKSPVKNDTEVSFADMFSTFGDADSEVQRVRRRTQ